MNINVNGSAIGHFEGLTFDSAVPGGFSTARYQLRRDPREYWDDALPYQSVIIEEGGEVFWEGRIDPPVRTLMDVGVDCLGWYSQMETQGTESNIFVGAGKYKASEFINTVMMADESLSLGVGVIDTGDYEFPNGHVFEWEHFTPYSQCLEELNQPNGYVYGVFSGRAFFYHPPSHIVKWRVFTADCDNLVIQPDTERMCNYLVVQYTPDGSTYLKSVTEDTASQERYGKIKKRIDVPGQCSADTADEIGEEYILETASLKVKAELTCNRVYNESGVEINPASVRPEGVLVLPDWNPAEELFGVITDLSTFLVKATSYDHASGRVQITPTQFIPSIEGTLAEMGIRGRLL